MQKFKVEIKEFLTEVVAVEAECLEDALEEVRNQYNNGEIVLDSSDFIGVEISQAGKLSESYYMESYLKSINVDSETVEKIKNGDFYEATNKSSISQNPANQIVSQVAIGDKQQNILSSELEDDYRHQQISGIYLAKSIINDYWHKEGWQVPLNLDKDLCISFNDYERQTGKRLLQIIPSSAHNTKAEAIIEALEQGYDFINEDDYVWYSKEEALGCIDNLVDAIKSIRSETKCPAEQISSFVKEANAAVDKTKHEDFV